MHRDRTKRRDLDSRYFFYLSPPNTAGTRTKALTLLLSLFLFRLARGFWRRNSASIFVGQTHPVSAFEWQLIGGKPHEQLISLKNGQLTRDPELDRATIRSGSCSNSRLATSSGPRHTAIGSSHLSLTLKRANAPPLDATTRRPVSLSTQAATRSKPGGSSDSRSTVIRLRFAAPQPAGTSIFGRRLNLLIERRLEVPDPYGVV